MTDRESKLVGGTSRLKQTNDLIEEPIKNLKANGKEMPEKTPEPKNEELKVHKKSNSPTP